MLHHKSELNKYAIFDLDAGFVLTHIGSVILQVAQCNTIHFHICSMNAI